MREIQSNVYIPDFKLLKGIMEFLTSNKIYFQN